LMERPVDKMTLIPCLCNCSIAFWAEAGTWWVLKLKSVPSLSQRTAMILGYCIIQRHDFIIYPIFALWIIMPLSVITFENLFMKRNLLKVLWEIIMAQNCT